MFLAVRRVDIMRKNNNNQSVLMTEGSIPRLVISFAGPIFLGNLFQQLYNLVDSVIVGNFVGDDALAAVSSSGNLIFMMIGLIFGLFGGAGVVIAKYFGAERNDLVQKAIHTTIALALICGIILMFLGWFLAPLMLHWMDTPDRVIGQSILYFRVYFLGGIFICLYNSASCIFQAVGDSKHPVYYLIISAITNVVLDLFFVGFLGIGIIGAALATCISQALSAILSIYRLTKSDDVFRVHLGEIRIHGDMIGEILRMGIPSGIQNSVIGFANVVVQANINSFGELAMAGCGAYSKIEGFAFLPITSFSMALTTFVGQNVGAGKKERVHAGARFGIFSAMISAEVIGLLIYVFIPDLVRLFSQNPDVIAYGTEWARVTAFFYFLLAASHAEAGVLRGAGKSTVPMLVMLLCWCVIRVTYITIITSFVPSITVVFYAYPITWSLSTAFFTIYLLLYWRRKAKA